MLDFCTSLNSDLQFSITDECGNPQSTPVRFVIVEDARRQALTENFVVYPVPAKDKLMIAPTASENIVMTTMLYDLFGQEKVLNQTFYNNSVTLDVENLPEGIYILKIIGNKGDIVTRQITIEK